MAEVKETKDELETIVDSLREEYKKLNFYLSRKVVQANPNKPAIKMFTLEVTEFIFTDEEETEEIEVLFKSITAEESSASYASLKRAIEAKFKKERSVTKKFSRTVRGRVLYGDYEQEKSSVQSLGVRRIKM